jgi:hypothetical protein
MVFTEQVALPCTAFEDRADSSAEPELPEVPQDLDVCIAQRHFEEAYSCWREHESSLTRTLPQISGMPVNIARLLWCRSANLVTLEISKPCDKASVATKKLYFFIMQHCLGIIKYCT